MNIVELTKIKEYQREFEQKFGKKLYISWPEMKGVVPRINVGVVSIDDNFFQDNSMTAEQILEEVVAKHGTTVEAIRDRSKRAHAGPKHKERNALLEFSRIIVRSHMNRGHAGRLINRDRTTLYHFAKQADAQEM